MLYAVLFLKITLLNICFATFVTEESEEDDGVLGDDLVSKLQQDKNLDLSEDEEYEDLRAELLAYHTVLKKLKSESGRRGLITTPCWQLGGICIHYNLCSNGARFQSEIPGCKDKLHVCCFEWNKYRVRKEEPQYVQAYNGKGVVEVTKPSKKKSKKTTVSYPAWVTLKLKYDGDSEDNENALKKTTKSKHEFRKHLLGEKFNVNDDNVKLINDTDIVAVVIRAK